MAEIKDEKPQRRRLYQPPVRIQFKKKEQAIPQIPMTSMPDIVFMLLLFFMVATVFKEVTGLPVVLPFARQIEKLPGKHNIAYIYIDHNQQIAVDDQLLACDQLAEVMAQKQRENPRLVVSLKVDREVGMGLVSDVQQQLRKAGVLRICYSAHYREELDR